MWALTPILTAVLAASFAVFSLVGVSAESAQAAFPGQNGKIVFASCCRSSDNYEIYSMNADGTGTPTNLTNNPANDYDPAVSPDGTKIAFKRDNQVYVMNANGTGQTNLTNNGANDFTPDWGIASAPDAVNDDATTDENHPVDVYELATQVSPKLAVEWVQGHR